MVKFFVADMGLHRFVDVVFYRLKSLVVYLVQEYIVIRNAPGMCICNEVEDGAIYIDVIMWCSCEYLLVDYQLTLQVFRPNDVSSLSFSVLIRFRSISPLLLVVSCSKFLKRS